MQPTFRIAITGHRPNRMHVGVARIERQLFQVLRSLAKTARGHAVPQVPIAISALAEGSDRLFAQAALKLRMPLRVLLPFKSADYETTFGDAATTQVYRDLLAKAESVQELPGTLADSTAGYEAVGRATVDTCDVLVAVWDGKPAAGRGGTPEIIGYALGTGRSVIWIDAANRRRPILLSRDHTPIDANAARAGPMNPRTLRSVVSSA
jgi:hypothetical protein